MRGASLLTIFFCILLTTNSFGQSATSQYYAERCRLAALEADRNSQLQRGQIKKQNNTAYPKPSGERSSDLSDAEKAAKAKSDAQDLREQKDEMHYTSFEEVSNLINDNGLRSVKVNGLIVFRENDKWGLANLGGIAYPAIYTQIRFINNHYRL